VTGPILPRVFDEWHDGGRTFVILRRRPSTGYGTTPILRLLGCEEFRGAARRPLRWWPTRRSASTLQRDRRHAGLGHAPLGRGVDRLPRGDSNVHVVYQAGQETRARERLRGRARGDPRELPDLCSRSAADG
jgi:hypothetical protein